MRRTETPISATAVDSTREQAEQLIERARELGPVIREHLAEAEHERRLAKPVHDALRAAGFQRMLAPKSFGGLEVDPVTCAQVVEEIASFDSAAGWALQAPNVNVWWACRLADTGAEEIYGSDPSTPVAAAFHPPQLAIEVTGGFRVTGRSPLASNIHDCEWALFSGMIMDDGHARMTEFGPAMIAFILPTSDVEILDTWHTLGMRGTDSHDVMFRDVFVPASRTFPLAPQFQPGRHFQGPLYQFPAAGIIAIFSASVLLATARGAITELRELAGKKTPFGSLKTLSERGTVQSALAESEATLRAARALFYDTMAEAWARTSSNAGPYARATSGRAARDDPRSQERSAGDGYNAPTRRHDGHLHEESARPLLPRRTHAAAARLRVGEQARVDRPDLSRPAAGFPADRVLKIDPARAGENDDDDG